MLIPWRSFVKGNSTNIMASWNDYLKGNSTDIIGLACNVK